jgi:hypothetical protein
MLILDDRGQATPEYALVIVAAGAIAGSAILWAVKSHALTNLFGHVIQNISSKI